MMFCLWGLAGELGLAPALVGMYRIGRTARSPWVTAVWVVASVATIEATVLGEQLGTIAARDATLSVLFSLVSLTSPAALGMLITTRQRLATSLAELRLAREAELESRAERARSAERARIAREIHDAVGHHATLIAVEAAALETTTGETETKASAGRIRGLAKASLAEMRSALGLVGGRTEVGNGLAEVADLVAQARESGLTVDFAGVPDLDVLPAVGRAAFRIVQESLTNAAKHATGAAVEVTVRADQETLVVTVTSEPPPGDVESSDTGGLGLPGMAERAATVGGKLEITAHPGQLFTVRARLPLESYTPPKVDETEPTIDGSQAAMDTR
jgi:signal transduction histidine kinase